MSQQAAGLMLGQVDSSAKDAHTRATSHPLLKRDESLTGKAAKKNQSEKRAVSTPDDNVAGNNSAPKKRPRAGTEDTIDGKKRKKEKTPKNTSQDVSSALAQLGKAAADAANSPLKPPAQDLLDFASSCPSLPEKPISRGSVSDLLSAAESEEKADAAGAILIEIKAQDDVAWQDTSPVHTFSELERARARGESIDLPNFSSVLPQLPEEPELVLPLTFSEKKKRRKHKSLLDSDSLNGSSKVKGVGEAEAANQSIVETQTIAPPVFDYAHPIDPWWPSIAEIRKERKAVGAPPDDDSAQEEDDEGIFGVDVPFRANVSRIKERFANDVAPGVLEKLPHCRVHLTSWDSKKNMMFLEPVHCFQVTELYPKELMVCCSHCGSWRHAACGGHHKPYSVRECIEVPFAAVCDRCHAEEKLLREYPTAKKRLDRQRNEQLRRAMSTSATIRQLSFSKHGGSYKWPLGSVSTTHIGGHTRSVHVRQEKAEKQWKEMVTKLSKDYGAKTKERVRTRTRELEKLLSSVEDAGTYFRCWSAATGCMLEFTLRLTRLRTLLLCPSEGHTERHNMMLFLLQDTLKDVPVGFEKRRRNIFDPAEDDGASDDGDACSISVDGVSTTNAGSNENSDSQGGGGGKRDVRTVCIRKDCCNKSRFDSVFCSDGCGVACLEADLLRTFNYVSDVHPALFRN